MYYEMRMKFFWKNPWKESALKMVQNCVKWKRVLRGTDQLPEEKGALKDGAWLSLWSFSISSSSLDDEDQLAMSHMKNSNLTQLYSTCKEIPWVCAVIVKPWIGCCPYLWALHTEKIMEQQWE